MKDVNKRCGIDHKLKKDLLIRIDWYMFRFKINGLCSIIRQNKKNSIAKKNKKTHGSLKTSSWPYTFPNTRIYFKILSWFCRELFISLKYPSLANYHFYKFLRLQKKKNVSTRNKIMNGLLKNPIQLFIDNFFI